MEALSIPYQILQILYLVSAVLFIIGLKMQSSPDSARKGNIVAAFAMGLAIISTIVFYSPLNNSSEILHFNPINYLVVVGGILVGGIVGLVMAKKVKMTAMPEMVSFFNGMGGASALVISIAEFMHIQQRLDVGTYLSGMGEPITAFPVVSFISLFAGMLIGGIAFTGSLIAYGKLQGKIKDFFLPGQQIINLILIGVMCYMGYMVLSTGNIMFLYVAVGVCLLYGVLFVLPIGGADMPVVISLLNSFTGIAATFAGLMFNNKAMITGGILVGSAGTILTVLMCEAMNRSLWNVLVGAFGASAGGTSSDQGDQVHKEANHTDVAIMCYYADKVIIVPGYGMAVAQAQHAVHDVEKLLEANGVEVKYAIHPVAGRMPGHMNVLLAEADVPYPKLLEMDSANPEFKTTDVVLVIGANDVVNPAAGDDPGSPIYGMPVLTVWDAKNTIVFKRSMNPGYAGIQNPLFFRDKTKMLFGDAKASLEALSTEIKSM